MKNTTPLMKILLQNFSQKSLKELQKNVSRQDKSLKDPERFSLWVQDYLINSMPDLFDEYDVEW
jgi:hypothetical protein